MPVQLVYLHHDPVVIDYETCRRASRRSRDLVLDVLTECRRDDDDDDVRATASGHPRAGNVLQLPTSYLR